MPGLLKGTRRRRVGRALDENGAGPERAGTRGKGRISHKNMIQPYLGEQGLEAGEDRKHPRKRREGQYYWNIKI